MARRKPPAPPPKDPIIPEEIDDTGEPEAIPEEIVDRYPSGKRSLVRLLLGATAAAVKLAARTSGASARLEAVISSPEHRRMLAEAGASIRDLREVAGLTVREVSEAIQLPDASILKKVENGTATLSFELILRLSSLLARHDPVPFIIRYTRTYNPEVWTILENWGLGRLPLLMERERELVNIYRRHDIARELSDEGFARVLSVTRAAFEMALEYAAEAEGLERPQSSSKRKPSSSS